MPTIPHVMEPDILYIKRSGPHGFTGMRIAEA
jgi:hypothetical protein